MSLSFILLFQVFVHGESLKASIVAIVVPDPETLDSWCASRSVEGTYEELCKNPKVSKLVLDDLLAVGKLRHLHGFELVSGTFTKN